VLRTKTLGPVTVLAPFTIIGLARFKWWCRPGGEGRPRSDGALVLTVPPLRARLPLPKEPLFPRFRVTPAAPTPMVLVLVIAPGC